MTTRRSTTNERNVKTVTRICQPLVLATLLAFTGCQNQKLSLPARGVPFTASLYGSTVIRLTDKNIDGYSGPGIQNEYARADAENSSGRYLVLRSNDGEWYLYDRVALATISHLENLGSIEEPEPRWDPADSNAFYYLHATELRRYDIATASSNLVHDFRTEYPGCQAITTKTEGDASLDRRFWCFIIEDSLDNVLAVVVYDRQLDCIIGSKTSFPETLNWVSMDMSGRHCVIGYESRPAQIFSPDFSTALDLPAGANGHMDLAQTADGRDVMVYQNNATDWIAMADLETGAETPLIEIPFSTNTDIGLHFSGNCSQVPGWVLVSTYGAENPPAGQTHSWMDNLLFMLELKDNPRIVKVAGTHCYTGKHPVSNYFAEAYASINQAGTRIIYGSNWGLYKPDYTDAYEVRLPDGWNR
ncbi:MAG: hypothetical protein ABIL25_01565 [candidate division WOR-3 bacterium]